MISFFNFFSKKRKSHDVVKLLSPGDLFFDIGAHLGDKSQQFIDKNLKAIMVEPLPQCIDQLKVRFKENNNVEIIQKAVGRSNGNVILEVNSKTPTTSTMAKHWKKGRFSSEKWDQKISVEMTTLDQLISVYGIPNYIKIDVEGFELDVLFGLSQKVGIISFEFTSEFFDQTVHCLNYLKKIGYSEYNFSIGERRKFFFDWSNIDDLTKELKNEIQKDKLLWGDVYCK